MLVQTPKDVLVGVQPRLWRLCVPWAGGDVGSAAVVGQGYHDHINGIQSQLSFHYRPCQVWAWCVISVSALLLLDQPPTSCPAFPTTLASLAILSIYFLGKQSHILEVIQVKFWTISYSKMIETSIISCSKYDDCTTTVLVVLVCVSGRGRMMDEAGRTAVPALLYLCLLLTAAELITTAIALHQALICTRIFITSYLILGFDLLLLFAQQLYISSYIFLTGYTNSEVHKPTQKSTYKFTSPHTNSHVHKHTRKSISLDLMWQNVLRSFLYSPVLVWQWCYIMDRHSAAKNVAWTSFSEWVK